MISQSSGFGHAKDKLLNILLEENQDFFSSNTANNLRQSGGVEFKFATRCNNTDVFDAAFETARAIVKEDPALSLPEHDLLKKHIESKISVNLLTLS